MMQTICIHTSIPSLSNSWTTKFHKYDTRQHNWYEKTHTLTTDLTPAFHCFLSLPSSSLSLSASNDSSSTNSDNTRWLSPSPSRDEDRIRKPSSLEFQTTVRRSTVNFLHTMSRLSLSLSLSSLSCSALCLSVKLSSLRCVYHRTCLLPSVFHLFSHWSMTKSQMSDWHSLRPLETHC